MSRGWTWRKKKKKVGQPDHKWISNCFFLVQKKRNALQRQGWRYKNKGRNAIRRLGIEGWFLVHRICSFYGKQAQNSPSPSHLQPKNENTYLNSSSSQALIRQQCSGKLPILLLVLSLLEISVFFPGLMEIKTWPSICFLSSGDSIILFL